MNKLKIKTSGCDIVATYYQTDIVKIGNNTVTLDSGGYKTSSTRKNINRILDVYKVPFHVFQHEKEWKLVDRNGLFFPFEDGKQINITNK